MPADTATRAQSKILEGVGLATSAVHESMITMQTNPLRGWLQGYSLMHLIKWKHTPMSCPSRWCCATDGSES